MVDGGEKRRIQTNAIQLGKKIYRPDEGFGERYLWLKKANSVQDLRLRRSTKQAREWKLAA